MAMVVKGKTVLYVCPYCNKGRFTADDGWEGAKRHIREVHQDGRRVDPRRGRPPRRNFDEGGEGGEEPPFG